MTNPYESYMSKQALFGALVGAANSLAQSPQMGDLVGGAIGIAGKVFRHKGTQDFGQFIRTHSTGAMGHIHKFLDNDMGGKLPSANYDLSKLHPWVKAPMSGLMGMHVDGPAKMTPQRAAVWAGGAIGLGGTAKAIGDLAGSGEQAVSRGMGAQNNFLPEGYQSQAKEAAVKQAREDFKALFKEI